MSENKFPYHSFTIFYLQHVQKINKPNVDMKKKDEFHFHFLLVSMTLQYDKDLYQTIKLIFTQRSSFSYKFKQ